MSGRPQLAPGSKRRPPGDLVQAGTIVGSSADVGTAKIVRLAQNEETFISHQALAIYIASTPRRSDDPKILRFQDSATCRKPDRRETFTRIHSARPETKRRHHGAGFRVKYLTRRRRQYHHHDSGRMPPNSAREMQGGAERPYELLRVINGFSSSRGLASKRTWGTSDTGRRQPTNWVDEVKDRPYRRADG
ncbi:hypothetical protein Taro_042867 [Colocasia esculenta]|uniref:Uncharacterized protein n=1 Tax=Colocasia esculenta TaxID=4460 RepID=A0A843X0D9_COLES|nr:hypothetical protein [Colocasia esculenta]